MKTAILIIGAILLLPVIVKTAAADRKIESDKKKMIDRDFSKNTDQQDIT